MFRAGFPGPQMFSDGKCGAEVYKINYILKKADSAVKNRRNFPHFWGSCSYIGQVLYDCLKDCYYQVEEPDPIKHPITSLLPEQKYCLFL